MFAKKKGAEGGKGEDPERAIEGEFLGQKVKAQGINWSWWQPQQAQAGSLGHTQAHLHLAPEPLHATGGHLSDSRHSPVNPSEPRPLRFLRTQSLRLTHSLWPASDRLPRPPRVTPTPGLQPAGSLDLPR